MLSGTLGEGASEGGQVTVVSESSNVISHSLVYQCALSGVGGDWPGYSTSLSGCSSSVDVSGLSLRQTPGSRIRSMPAPRWPRA